MPFNPTLNFLFGSRPPPPRRGPGNHRILQLGASAAGCICFASVGKLGAKQNRGRQAVKPRSYSDFGHSDRRVTDSLLTINALLFALSLLSKNRLQIWGAKHTASILAGEWWRVITPNFLHANLFHLAVNSMSLNSVGPLLEVIGGRPRFLSVYSVAALTSVTASCLGTAQPSLGASGAIFGLAGALGVFFQRHRERLGPGGDQVLQSLCRNLAINVAYGFMSPQIDNWGHLGGLLGGAVAAYLLGPSLKRVQDPETHRYAMIDKPPIPIFASRQPA